MKTKLILAITILFSCVCLSQNEINYKAIISDGSGNTVSNQSVDLLLLIRENGSPSVIYSETHTVMSDANGLVILNIGDGTPGIGTYSAINWESYNHNLNVHVDIGAGLVDMGITEFKTVPYAHYAANVTGLEALDEGNGIGYRIKARNPSNNNNIGLGAIDLSKSFSADEGATGTNSTSFGVNTTASGVYSTAIGFFSEASGYNSTAMGTFSLAEARNSTAIGRYNIGGGFPVNWIETDPLFEIGNGTSSNRSNALTILKNGTIKAPSFDISEITDDKALITKEYADTNLASSGLENLNAGIGTAYRLIGQDPANYGTIGGNAVDLSINTTSSSTHGATGGHSFASGGLTTASGNFSTAMGQSSNASGTSSTALGASSTASGYQSVAIGSVARALGSQSLAMGISTFANAHASASLGRLNIGGGDSVNWVLTDPLFEIGNGTDIANRSNALTVLKNGKVGIGEHQPTGFLEVNANNSSSEPNVNLIDQGNSGARINFSNTLTTNGNVWTLSGDTDDTDANSVFNFFHTNAPNNGNILQIQGDGRIGVNTAPDTRLHMAHLNGGGTSGFKLENASGGNFWRLYTTSGADGSLRFYSSTNGDANTASIHGATGVYSAISDRRLKTNFKSLYFDWKNFMNLDPLTYTYKADKKAELQIGMVAQDVQGIYPELVSYNSDEDVYHLNYSGFGVVAIKAIQEQQKIIEGQASKIEELEAKLSEKETELSSMNNRISRIEGMLLEK